MILFMVGDFRTNTGPGIANKMIRNGLKSNKNVIYSDAKSKIFRVIELFLKILFSDCICFCSFSKINRIGFKIAKLLNKKTFYIMHGYSTYEYKVNERNVSEEKLKEIKELEEYIFKHSEKIFCVSEKFMEFMKKKQVEYVNKFDYNYNGIDINRIEEIVLLNRNEKKANQIISFGGGIPQKNNIAVCQAINKLNQEKKMNLKYIVIGLPHRDKQSICSYNFVTYYDSLPHEEVIKILGESQIYIQNSIFETFGLSVIEALLSDCDLLISNNIGAISVLRTIEDRDLIFNVNDICEIAEKIEYLLYNNNSKRLRNGMNVNKIEYTNSAELLYKKIFNIWEKSHD